MIKRYTQFIKEADETEETKVPENETDSSDSSKFTEIKDEVKSMIENTIKNSGGEYSGFVDSFNKNPDDVKFD